VRFESALHLKECKLSAWRTAAGKLFHTTGPATEKVCAKFRPHTWNRVVGDILGRYIIYSDQGNVSLSLAAVRNSG